MTGALPERQELAERLRTSSPVYNSMGYSAATWRDEPFPATILGGFVLAAGR